MRWPCPTAAAACKPGMVRGFSAVAESPPAERDGAGGDDDDVDAAIAQRLGLVGERGHAHVRLVGEQARADLDHHAPGRTQLRPRLHGFGSAGVLPTQLRLLVRRPRHVERANQRGDVHVRRPGQLGLHLLDEQAPRHPPREPARAGQRALERVLERLAAGVADRLIHGVAQRLGLGAVEPEADVMARAVVIEERADLEGLHRLVGAADDQDRRGDPAPDLLRPPEQHRPQPGGVQHARAGRRGQLGDRVAVDVDAPQVGEPAHQPRAHLPGEQVVEVRHRHQAGGAREQRPPQDQPPVHGEMARRLAHDCTGRSLRLGASHRLIVGALGSPSRAASRPACARAFT